MKKQVLLAIILCLAVLLCGCSQNANGNDIQNTTTEPTNAETQGEFCRVLRLKEDGIIVWAGEYGHIYVKNVDVALDIKPLQTVVLDFSESDLQKANGTFTDSFGDEQTYSYILENPKSIRHTSSEEPTYG